MAARMCMSYLCKPGGCFVFHAAPVQHTWIAVDVQHVHHSWHLFYTGTKLSRNVV